jgi:hypothetical protein
MKKTILNLSALFFAQLAIGFSFAQTAGTLTFSFTEVSKSASATYQSQGKHVLAVWIQSTTGTGTATFVKTKMRYGGFNSTADHLPTWAVNSGGTANNCMSANCNVVSATTGATLSSFTNRSITWDGTNAAGVQVPDGTYKVTIEETWNHGGTGTTVRSFTFTKGPNADVQTPTADANFSNIALAWQPSGAGIEENTNTGITISPNPSSIGIFNVEFVQASSVKVLNATGEEVYAENVKAGETKATLNLSNLTNGVYFICVLDGDKVSKNKVVIQK